MSLRCRIGLHDWKRRTFYVCGYSTRVECWRCKKVRRG